MADRIKYEHFEALDQLIADGLLTRRPHPAYPIDIYNYTAKAQGTPLSQWTEPMMDCRGLILDRDGYIVGRPFRKFWNYAQVLDQIPADEPFQVWEKLDGSLGIVCSYAGERIVATRGSFESDQALWFGAWLDARHRNFTPSGETWLFEILYPENRIVVDYGDRHEAVLLDVLSPTGDQLQVLFNACQRFTKAKRFDGLEDFTSINENPDFEGQEGFVIRWASGFRAKVKLDEYCRLHKLITQCSTRTIWELLRSGAGVQELIDRVPDDFKAWVDTTASEIRRQAEKFNDDANTLYGYRPSGETRKEFALWAVQQPNCGLLFSLLDEKDITDACWKLAEPKWATPFRKEMDV